MTRKGVFIFSFLILAMVVTAGFFICIKNILAVENEIAGHDGNLSASAWVCNDCLQKESGGDYFIVASSSNMELISSEIDLNEYSAANLSFVSKTYYGTSVEAQIELYISINDGSDWILTTTTSPQNNNFRDNIFSFNLNSYLNKKIKIKLKTPKVDGRKSVGLDNISVKAEKSNQSPNAIATISTTTAGIDEEVFFDGSNSNDPDGSIADWIWDLAGEIIHASTTSKIFTTTGTKPIYFWAIDNEGASSSLAFSLDIISNSTSSNTTTTQIINPNDLVINEIYPAPPTGEQEWLELYNNTSSTINLSGLYLLDAKYSTTTLNGEIKAGEYLVIENIGGSLNNDGDAITLRNSEKIISQTAYGDFSNKRDQSWARTVSGDYAATIRITKGSVNIIEVKVITSSGGGSGNSSAVSKVTETVTSTVATTTATSTNTDYRGQLIINEILPNPAGADDDEFIELKNISDSDIELNGFYLSDNTNAKHVIKATEKLVITAGGLAVIKRASSTIALNNSGFEAVNLYDPEGELIDRVTYQAAKSEGQAYARNEAGEWLWTGSITPGEENIFGNQAEVMAAATAIVSKAKAAAKKSVLNYGSVDLERVPELVDGAIVTVKGIVSVEPGVLGVQIFYIAGSGIQIYSYKKDFPNLKIGDYIEVTGELSTASTGRRLKTKTQADIRFIEHRDPPTPHQLDNSEIDDNEGSLVIVNGTVLEIKSRNIMIDDGTTEIKVYVNNSIDLKDANIKTGDKLVVTGIVGKTSGGYRVMPRDLKDLKIEKGQVQGEFEKAPNKLNLNSPIYYLGAIIIFLVLVVAGLWFKLKKNNI